MKSDSAEYRIVGYRAIFDKIRERNRKKRERKGHGITSFTKVKKRKTFLLDKLRERKIKKQERQATSASIHMYRRPYNDEYVMTNIGDEYFDDYEGTGPEVLTWIQKLTFRVENFFQRTKTLRNVRLFWQQILFSIFFILG